MLFVTQPTQLLVQKYPFLSGMTGGQKRGIVRALVPEDCLLG
jgi:hypothetical protein